MINNIQIVYDIFADSTWENPYHFKTVINSITDKKFAVGLLVEFIRPGFNYDIRQEEVLEIISDVDSDIDFVEANDYYIDQIRQDIRTILLDFLHEGGEINNNQNLIDWVKSLSNNEVQILENYLVEKEMYEVIVFIMDKRK